MSLNPHHDERPARGARRVRPGDVDDLADRFGRMAPPAAIEGLDELEARYASLEDRVVKITGDLARQYHHLEVSDFGREQVIDLIRELFHTMGEVKFGIDAARGVNAGRNAVHGVASGLGELETLLGRAIEFHHTFERYGGYTSKRSRMPKGVAARLRVAPHEVFHTSATTHGHDSGDSEEETPLSRSRVEERRRDRGGR